MRERMERLETLDVVVHRRVRGHLLVDGFDDRLPLEEGHATPDPTVIGQHAEHGAPEIQHRVTIEHVSK